MITKEQQQIVEFMNEGDVLRSNVFRADMELAQDLLDSAADFREHTIKDFLQRPIPLASFEWTTTSSQFALLSSYQFPDQILATTLYQQKLYGFLGVRAGLKFRLQINSQPLS